MKIKKTSKSLYEIGRIKENYLNENGLAEFYEASLNNITSHSIIFLASCSKQRGIFLPNLSNSIFIKEFNEGFPFSFYSYGLELSNTENEFNLIEENAKFFVSLIENKSLFIDINAKIDFWDNYPIIEKARLYFHAKFFKTAKNYYDIFLDKIADNFSIKERNMLSEIVVEYIVTIKAMNNLDISENNLKYIAINKKKELIKSKKWDNKILTEDESNLEKLRIYTLDEYVHWGRYNKTSILEVLRKEPDYILWCISNLEHFAIISIIFMYPSIRKHSNFYQSLEQNLIKIAIINKWMVNDDYDDRSDDWMYDSKNQGGYDYDVFEDDPSSYWNID